MKTALRLAANLVFVVCIFASVVLAAPDIIVPDNYPTIQAAIDAAQNGDEIFVRAGSYSGPIVINKDGLILAGENQAAVITGVSASAVVTVDVNTTTNTVIRGFKITKGLVGIRVLGNVSHLVVQNNNITQNYDLLFGTNILLETGADALIQNNSITGSGRCIESLGDNTVTISSNLISGCRGALGGGVLLNDTFARIDNNTVSGCWDGAIRLSGGSKGGISNNRILNNGGWDTPSGVYIYESWAVLWKNLIRGNSTSNFGGTPGIGAVRSSVQIYNNTLHDNSFSRPDRNGSAMNITYSTFIARNNIFSQNGNSATPAAVFSFASVHDFSYNDFWNNLTIANTEGIVLGPGNLTVDPLYVSGSNQNLSPGSPVIDMGDPDPAFNDTNGTRNDMGYTGGPSILQLFPVIPVVAPNREILDVVGDGDVDNGDYLEWRSHFGEVLASPYYAFSCDISSSGAIDAADYTLWRDLVGTTAPSRADIDDCGRENVVLNTEELFGFNEPLFNYSWTESYKGIISTLYSGPEGPITVSLKGPGTHLLMFSARDAFSQLRAGSVSIRLLEAGSPSGQTALLPPPQESAPPAAATQNSKARNKVFNASRGEMGDIDVPDGSGDIEVRIIDRRGHLIRHLHFSSGVALQWDGRDDAGHLVAPGLYHVLSRVGSSFQKSKMLVRN